MRKKGAKGTWFVSLRVKLLIAFTLLFSLVFSLAYVWFYNFATQVVMRQIQGDMVVTLQGATEGVDVQRFEALAAEAEAGQADEHNPDYQQHLQWLKTVRGIEPRAVVYTFVAGQDPYQVIWIGDVTKTFDPGRAANFGETYLADPAKTKLYAGLATLTVNMQPYADKWGQWVSAYGPIKDGNGHVIGGLGIDFRADYVSTVQQSIINSVFLALLFTYTVLFITVWLLSNILTGPIIKLTRWAARIGEGDYEPDFGQLITGRLRDEIDALAGVFEIMVDKVRTREQSLRLQVEELKIEIDETKRAQQVAEIVDGDFFQGLQEKAKRMRARRDSS
jgi:HAMP domain-containing protein